MQVPFMDLKAQHAALKGEILPLWEEIYDSAGFIGGPHVEGLEKEFAAACDVSHCVALNSGTDALLLIFEALGLKPGDEVIVPANTFIATSEAVTKAGGRVAFVDVLPDTYNMDPAKIEAAITPKTKGIAPVHLYGQSADMDAICAIAKAHGLWVVEDASQAHLSEYKGRKVGTMGAAAAWSFYPGKNMGACGEGGAATTNDAALAQTVAKLRDHGSAKKYYHDLEGWNARCDAVQAAALRVKLKHLPAWTEKRRALAARYIARLSGAPAITLPVVAEGCRPVWHLFVVQVDNRDEIQKTLQANGISAGLHYPLPLHLQNAYRYLGFQEGAFPVSEAYCKRLLSLPLYPEMTDEQLDYVCDTLLAAVRG